MKNLNDFDKMLKNITDSAINGGWDKKIYDPSVLKEEMVYLYIYDPLANLTWMASVAKENFLKAANHGRTYNKDEQSDVRASIAYNASVLAGIITPANDVQMEVIEHNVGIAISLYAGATATFKIANEFKDGGHFCVMIYRKNKDDTSDITIRPFADTADFGGAMPVERFQEYGMQVLQYDHKKHPEWF